MAPPPAASKKKQDEHTAADYYFDSYSHYGVSKRRRKRWRVGGGDWRAADSRPPAFTRGGMGPTRLSAAAAAARETLSHQNAPLSRFLSLLPCFIVPFFPQASTRKC